MNSPEVISAALMLRSAIKTKSHPTLINKNIQLLARAMDGYADMGQMDPGQAALYLVALHLSQLGDE